MILLFPQALLNHIYTVHMSDLCISRSAKLMLMLTTINMVTSRIVRVETMIFLWKTPGGIRVSQTRDASTFN